MQRAMQRKWRPVPLSVEFHQALEGGDWAKALAHYHAHPYHAPPLDTFELLRLILARTPVCTRSVLRRLDARLGRARNDRKAPQRVAWNTFWDGLNRGDGRTVSQALSGAHINGLSAQTAVAEACAVLLRAHGPQWRRQLVDETHFAAVTGHNLVSLTLERGRWDLALEIVNHTRLARADAMSLWPLARAAGPWHIALAFATAIPKSIAPETALPQLLESGCPLPVLTAQLERVRVLGDVTVVAPLIDHAITTGDWAFVARGAAHLADIDAITQTALGLFQRLCAEHGVAAVATRLRGLRIPLHQMRIEDLEGLNM